MQWCVYIRCGSGVFLSACIAQMMLFLEWNMLPHKPAEGRVGEDGWMDGWNMFLKIASSFGASALRTHLHPNHRSWWEKVILIKVPKVLWGSLFWDSRAAPAARSHPTQRTNEQMLEITEPLLNGACLMCRTGGLEQNMLSRFVVYG